MEENFIRARIALNRGSLRIESSIHSTFTRTKIVGGPSAVTKYARHEQLIDRDRRDRCERGSKMAA
jgi:hypothetical protein